MSLPCPCPATDAAVRMHQRTVHPIRRLVISRRHCSLLSIVIAVAGGRLVPPPTSQAHHAPCCLYRQSRTTRVLVARAVLHAYSSLRCPDACRQSASVVRVAAALVIWGSRTHTTVARLSLSRQRGYEHGGWSVVFVPRHDIAPQHSSHSSELGGWPLCQCQLQLEVQGSQVQSSSSNCSVRAAVGWLESILLKQGHYRVLCAARCGIDACEPS